MLLVATARPSAAAVSKTTLSLHATRSTGNSSRSAEGVFGLIRSDLSVDLIAVLAVVGDRRLHQSRRDLKVCSCLGEVDQWVGFAEQTFFDIALSKGAFGKVGAPRAADHPQQSRFGALREELRERQLFGAGGWLAGEYPCLSSSYRAAGSLEHTRELAQR